TRFDFQARAAAGREVPLIGDAPARDENHPGKPRLCRGNDQTAPRRAQALGARQLADELLQCSDTVPQTRCIFVAAALSKVVEALIQPRQSELRTFELFTRRAVQRPTREPGARPASQRTELGGRLRADELVSAPTEVHIPIGACVASIRGWPELAQQSQLFQ